MWLGSASLAGHDRHLIKQWFEQAPIQLARVVIALEEPYPQYAEQMVNAEPQRYRKWGSTSFLLIAGSRNLLQKKTSLQTDAHDGTLSYKLSWGIDGGLEPKFKSGLVFL
jgi:hypothetical protein